MKVRDIRNEARESVVSLIRAHAEFRDNDLWVETENYTDDELVLFADELDRITYRIERTIK